ncbi:MAG TPA: hypothetical protein VLA52_01835 [Thermohalobaculum sp.]|nr:hypothetical protein [Thermohalobaculum sp.]
MAKTGVMTGVAMSIPRWKSYRSFSEFSGRGPKGEFSGRSV